MGKRKLIHEMRGGAGSRALYCYLPLRHFHRVGSHSVSAGWYTKRETAAKHLRAALLKLRARIDAALAELEAMADGED